MPPPIPMIPANRPSKRLITIFEYILYLWFTKFCLDSFGLIHIKNPEAINPEPSNSIKTISLTCIDPPIKDAGTESIISGIENRHGIKSWSWYLKQFPKTTTMLHESAMIGIYLKSKSASTSNALYVDPPPNPTAAYSNADMKNKKVVIVDLRQSFERSSLKYNKVFYLRILPQIYKFLSPKLVSFFLKTRALQFL